MIVPMTRVVVLGPRRLRAAVVDAVQDLGVLHVDDARIANETVRPEKLSDEDEAERAAADALRMRADGVLALLPPVEAAQQPTALYAPEPTASLPQRLEGVERSVHALTRRLLEAEEEREVLGAYGQAIQTVAPLLVLFERSPRLDAVGFLLDVRTPGRIEAVRASLEAATQGRVVLVADLVGDHVIGAVAHVRRDAEAVRAVLTRAGASELRLPARVQGKPLREAIPELKARADALPGEIEELKRQLAEVSRRHRAEVASAAVAARDAVERFALMEKLPVSRYVFALHGWIPAHQVPRIRRGLAHLFGVDVLVYDEPAPARHTDAVPVLLNNPAWLKPFELFLRIFDPPRYGTFDPTIFFAIGIPLYVGLIIGDVGYGLCLLAVTVWLRAKANTGRPWHIVLGGLDFGFTLTPAAMRLVAVLMGWMTASTLAFGVAFGEVFGDLPQRLVPGFHPVFDRLERLTAYLYLSIGFGLAQVCLGLVLQMVKAVRRRERRELLETLAVLSGATTVFTWIAMQVHVLPAGALQPVLITAAATFVLSLLGSHTFGSVMWVMESVSAFGHVISYARIFAVGIASLGLAIVANSLGASVPAVFLGVLVGAVAHTMFFGLTIIGHVLQPARLHWVEFFSQFKYYQDTGRPYRPFQRLGGGNT
jgi:V/A-type H+-transporting ATPase subunit I